MERDPKETGFFNRYRTAIFISSLSASSIGFLTGLWTSTYMLSNLKAGEICGDAEGLVHSNIKRHCLPSSLNRLFLV